MEVPHAPKTNQKERWSQRRDHLMGTSASGMSAEFEPADVSARQVSTCGRGNVKKIVYSRTFTNIFPGSASGKKYLSCSWGQGRFEFL